jgi:hypothetical protein
MVFSRRSRISRFKKQLSVAFGLMIDALPPARRPRCPYRVHQRSSAVSRRLHPPVSGWANHDSPLRPPVLLCVLGDSVARKPFPVALHGLFASFAYFAVDLRQSAKSVDQVQLAVGIIRATVEKGKHPARQKFFIPSRTRSYAISGRPARPEFRHDSCNTAPR